MAPGRPRRPYPPQCDANPFVKGTVWGCGPAGDQPGRSKSSGTGQLTLGACHVTAAIRRPSTSRTCPTAPYVEVTANPLRVLQNTTHNDVSVRRIVLGRATGHRTIKVPAWHGMDPEH